MSYDANSTDSMLSRILERMDAQDAKLQIIHEQVVLTNGRPIVEPLKPVVPS